MSRTKRPWKVDFSFPTDVLAESRANYFKGWYQVVPNTAIESFQITGDID